MVMNHDAFHQFRRSQDPIPAFDGERVIYDSQPAVAPSGAGPKQSSPASIDPRLLYSLVNLRDIPANQPQPPQPNKLISAKIPVSQQSPISEDAVRVLPSLHERLAGIQETPNRIDLPPSNPPFFRLQRNPMEHELSRGQQAHLPDQPPAGGYGPSSDHMGTATSNVNLTTASSSTDLSASSYSPTVTPSGRAPQLASIYPPMHTHQQHAPPQQQLGMSPSAAYYAAQQTQPRNPGQQHQQHQHQHYMSQPMSPTLYYPTFPHMHQQTPSPNVYNVNQGYMSASAGPSMPVTTYAYSHPYPAHVSDHQMHPFAYPAVGTMTATPLPIYSEHDAQGHQQQMQNRSGSMDMMTGYVPILTTTSPPYGYSIPAYAPTGGSIFTPQYSGGHPYSYAPQPSQPFSSGYGQNHQAHRPPPLAPIQGPSQGALEHPHAPLSPLAFSNPNQGTPGGYSPIIVAPSPTSNPARASDSLLARSASGSNLFGTLGLNPGANSSINSGYGSSGTASSGEVVTLNRMGGGLDSTRSMVPTGPLDTEGVRPLLEPSSSTSQRERATTRGSTPANRQGDRPEQTTRAVAASQGERSEWVMWVGNVPGDASLDELYTFFGQGPPILEEERKAAEGGENVENIPQVEGAALEPPPRGDPEQGNANLGVGVGRLSGVLSVFLISRSNCAFVNYVSEASLQRGVDWFNGRPLRNPQVDPRCPKLVCRVRKKGDDIKAGVGGQRGVGVHARWVKEKMAAEETATPQGGTSPAERPPLVHGGPAGNTKKSSSGSSGSYASTTSSMLTKYFPTRYFILKSLTQHDLNLSVECELWATQVHNQEVLDRAYRNCQTVYLIFGVNKSGEFFGYAKMDGPISSVERNPSIEWAAREPVISPGSAKSPVAARGTPSQPTIREDKEKEAPEQEAVPRLDLAPPPTEDENPSIPPSERAATDEWVPPKVAELARHSFPDGFPSRREEEEVVTLPHHQMSEPAQTRQRQAQREQLEEILAAQHDHSLEPERRESLVSPARRLHPSMAHVLPGFFQDSPDPLTPGEDRKLHSLEDTIVSEPPLPSQPLQSQEQAKVLSKKDPSKGSSGFSIASAPAVMSQAHRPLSASSPVMSSDTWDERRKGASMWTKEHSIEEETESAEDVHDIPFSSHSLPPENVLTPVKETDEASTPLRIDLPPAPVSLEHLDIPDLHPPNSTPLDSTRGSSTQGGTVQLKEENPLSDTLAPIGGREEGWGTPFKVKWIRTDPLPFHRTRHLRNPWNHDREIKVSRDGTEIEPGVGQTLIEEWNRTDTGAIPARSALIPRSPTTYGGPPSPVQTFIPRARGRGRGGMGGGWVQRDTGQ